MPPEKKKTGRPRVTNPKGIRSLRIDDDLWARVQVIAEAEHRSASAQITVFLEEAVAAWSKRSGRR